MKILGFIFESRPSVGAHVQHCIDKFNKALWALTHLKRASISSDVLVRVYLVMLRPLLEYCAPVFHPMLTASMSENLERQQKRALKIIFGFETTYEELLLKTNIPKLSIRRESACTTFTEKLLMSERFNYLFPLNNQDVNGMNLRTTNVYREDFARTERLYRSPVFTMRRNLNNNR